MNLYSFESSISSATNVEIAKLCFSSILLSWQSNGVDEGVIFVCAF
jgi:hypothetical protein